MVSRVKPIPDGASVVIPRLVCRDPGVVIDFITHTFGAEERVRRPGPDGTVAHALLTIGPARIMIEGEWPTVAIRAPKPDGSSPVVLYAGAKIVIPIADQFWGDRTAGVMDPAGHVRTVATRIEETTEDERQARLSPILTASTERHERP